MLMSGSGGREGTDSSLEIDGARNGKYDSEGILLGGDGMLTLEPANELDGESLSLAIVTNNEESLESSIVTFAADLRVTLEQERSLINDMHLGSVDTHEDVGQRGRSARGVNHKRAGSGYGTATHGTGPDGVMADGARAEGVGAEDQDGDTEGTASFFGATASGKRFVFVVDTSTSMRGERWLALCEELEKAIQSLNRNQEFFIVGFDSSPHPMFGKFPPQGKYLRSDAATLKRVKNWLKSFELGKRTYPAQALMIGLQLNPDAIFLLSDGELMDNTVYQLRRHNYAEGNGYYRWSIPIHTILLHSRAGYSTLQMIAEENHGTFTPVDVPME